MWCQPQQTSSLLCWPQWTLRWISTCQGHIPSSLWTHPNLVQQMWQQCPQNMLTGVYRACWMVSEPRWAPAQFWDVLPEPPQAIPQSRLPTVYSIITNPLKTAANAFWLFHKYFFHPLHDLDAFVSLGNLLNVIAPVPPPPPLQPEEIVHDPPWPFLNMSV